MKSPEGARPPPGFAPIEFVNGFTESDRKAILANVVYACGLGYEAVDRKPARPETLCIVGCGPSLEGQIETLRNLGPDHLILAANQAHDYLIENGIIPWGFIYMEIHPWDEPMCKLPADCTYFIASHCARPIFDHLSGRNIVLWHCFQDVGEEEIIANSCPGLMIWGGGTPTLRAFNLGLALGFRRIETFGIDACYSDRSHAVYREGGFREDWDMKKAVEVRCAGRDFLTQPYLARQADEFTRFMKAHHDKFILRTHGDGLIQHIHRTMFPRVYEQEHSCCPMPSHRKP